MQAQNTRLAATGIFAVALLATVPNFALAQDAAADDSSQVRSDQTADAEDVVPQIDWDALKWDSPTLVNPDAQKGWNLPSRSQASNNAVWNRKDNNDGTTALTVKKQLPTTFDAKVGADLGLASQPTALQSDRLAIGTTIANSGVAWANISPLPGASIDARLDPQQDQAVFGTTLSKSLPIGKDFSVTMQNGYSITDTYGVSSTSSVPGLMAMPQSTIVNPSRTYSTDGLARFTILPSDTSLLAGTKLSSSDDRWLRSVGAEQKLFGDINISGTVSETTTGTYDKSITAGFKKAW